MSKIVPSSSSEIGNTKQISPAKYWCFTLHKYSDEDIEDICSSKSSMYEYFFSEEFGKSGETPHLQGFLIFHKKSRPKGLFKNKTYHFEKMRGNLKQNLDYCSKEGYKFYTNMDIPDPIKYLRVEDMYTYQRHILNICKLKNFIDDRHIYWFIGEKGIGKTKLLKVLCGKHKAYILPSTKRHALSQVQKTHEKAKAYVFNLSADKSEYQTNEFFDILETIKDGVFSTGFGTDNNEMCITNDKIVLVMANRPPDFDKTEIDKKRFIIFDIERYICLEREGAKVDYGLNPYDPYDPFDDPDYKM